MQVRTLLYNRQGQLVSLIQLGPGEFTGTDVSNIVQFVFGATHRWIDR